MSMTPLIFGFLLTANCYPIKEDINQNLDNQITIEDFNNKNVAELKDALKDVAYVQEFKNMMADYVKSQYKDLTAREMESVKEYLEEFCNKFAIDLKNIIDNGVGDVVIEDIEDGLSDATFDSVKDCITKELPIVKADTVDHIIYVLRKNLFETRQKIDRIINESKMASVKNSD